MHIRLTIHVWTGDVMLVSEVELAMHRRVEHETHLALLILECLSLSFSLRMGLLLAVLQMLNGAASTSITPSSLSASSKTACILGAINGP